MIGAKESPWLPFRALPPDSRDDSDNGFRLSIWQVEPEISNVLSCVFKHSTWGMGMKVDQKEVEHVAMLARIELTEEEKDLYSEQLSTILEFFDRLKELDTEGVPPTSHVVDLVNVYRPDHVRPGPGVEAVLRNAPDRANRFFRVPKILD